MDNQTVDITRSQQKALFKISWSYEYKSGEEIIYPQGLYDEVIRKNQIVVCDEIGSSSFQKSVAIDGEDATFHTVVENMRRLIKKGDCFILSETPNVKTKNQVRYFGEIIGDEWKRLEQINGLDLNPNLHYYVVDVKFYNELIPDNQRGLNKRTQRFKLLELKNRYGWIPNSGICIINVPEAHYELFDYVVFEPYFGCTIKDYGFNYEEVGIKNFDEKSSSFNIWKFSMGSFSKNTFDECEKNHVIRIDQYSKTSGKINADDKFKDEMKIGDYFFLCKKNKNNTSNVYLLGKITSNSEEIKDGNKIQYQRSYDVIARADEKELYNGLYKGWAPNYNSTCFKVPRNEYGVFQEQILLKFFDIKINDLFSKMEIESDYRVKGEIDMTEISYPLNQILYGPPGTGKTYNTINYAVAICEGKTVEEIETWKRKKVLEKYEELSEAGRIAFVTFHQSFGYEEFIEGIKPDLSEDEDEAEEANKLEYIIKDGVFKSFCKKASGNGIDFDAAWNKLIGIIEDIDHNGFYTFARTNKPMEVELTDDGALKHQWGGDTAPSVKYKKEEVKEQFENPEIYANRKDKTRGTSQHISNVQAIVNELIKICSKEVDGHNQKNYVFIIDEINRGNISKIFGEIITLVEESKRLGAEEQLTVKLPYTSEESFGVPGNVYILGTMNTADRSITSIDTALRRRFQFREMPPKPELLNGVVIDGLDIKVMMEEINRRIEYLYDREHTIGHAYFLPLKDDMRKERLAKIFELQIIPLLQEYFYNDYRKIMLVLGDDWSKKTNDERFIIREELPGDLFNSDKDSDQMEGIVEERYYLNKGALKNINSYKKISKKLWTE